MKSITKLFILFYFIHSMCVCHYLFCYSRLYSSFFVSNCHSFWNEIATIADSIASWNTFSFWNSLTNSFWMKDFTKNAIIKLCTMHSFRRLVIARSCSNIWAGILCELNIVHWIYNVVLTLVCHVVLSSRHGVKTIVRFYYSAWHIRSNTMRRHLFFVRLFVLYVILLL